MEPWNPNQITLHLMLTSPESPGSKKCVNGTREGEGKCTWFVPWIYRQVHPRRYQSPHFKQESSWERTGACRDNSWRNVVPLHQYSEWDVRRNLFCLAAGAGTGAVGGVYSSIASSQSSEDLSDVGCAYTKSQNTNIIPFTRLLLRAKNFSVMT